MIDKSDHIQVRTGIGPIWIGSIGEMVTVVSFHAPALPNENASPVLIEAAEQIDAYFDQRLQKFDLPLQLIGSDHQRKVWEIISEIPFGNTLTYSAIAERFGGTTFARAVGTACSANPIPIIIPCHRVIASTGKLTGYLGGIDRKRQLLELERAIPELQQELF